MHLPRKVGLGHHVEHDLPRGVDADAEWSEWTSPAVDAQINGNRTRYQAQIRADHRGAGYTDARTFAPYAHPQSMRRPPLRPAGDRLAGLS